MDYELQFLIMIDVDCELNQLINVIREKWQDIKWVRPSSFDFDDNWIQLSKNTSYNATDLSDPENGFLYYPYMMEVSPNRDRTVEEQIRLARLLENRLKEIGCTPIICADFEELLT